MNAAVFIEFLKPLMAGAKRAIFLIVDRGPAHIAKKTRAFVDSQHGRLQLFFLPPYSPDRNPDELVWKHLKADTVGRMTITEKAYTFANFPGGNTQSYPMPGSAPDTGAATVNTLGYSGFLPSGGAQDSTVAGNSVSSAGVTLYTPAANKVLTGALATTC